MLETVTFPVGACSNCGPNRLMATVLSADEDLVLACVHCDTPTPIGFRPMFVGPLGLQNYGYDVDDELEKLGCGTGGSCGGSCGTS